MKLNFMLMFFLSSLNFGFYNYPRCGCRRVRKSGKVEHHLWKKRESAGSGQKALNLVRIVSFVKLLWLITIVCTLKGIFSRIPEVDIF